PFADLDAVGAGTNGFVRTTDLFGRIGFHVEHVDMTGPAPLEEENDRFNPRLRSLGLRSLRLLGGFGAQQTRQRHATKSKAPDLEQLSARPGGRVKARAGVGMRAGHHGIVISNPPQLTTIASLNLGHHDASVYL